MYLRASQNMVEKSCIENLISEVSKHEELFNTANKYYFDSEVKNQIWNEIGQKLNNKPEFCKSRWRNLRTCFVNELRKYDRGPNLSKKTKKYMYYDKMLFLLPHLQCRKVIPRDVSDLMESRKSNNEYENSQQSTGSNKEFIDLSTEFMVHDYKDEEQDPICIEETDMNFENNSFQAIHYQNKEDKDDALKCFFNAMYKTVQTFPPHLQVASKKAIFNIISNFEEKTLQETSACTSSNRNNFAS